MKLSINKINSINVFISLIAIFLLAYLIINNEYKELEKDINEIKTTYIKNQKLILQDRVVNILKFIDYKIENKEPIESILKDIKHLTFNKELNQHLFIYDINGINILDPTMESNQGKSFINYQDKNGKFVIKDIIKKAKNSNDGFIKYYWNKPTSKIETPKISYIIKYKKLNWILGSGIFLDDIHNSIKSKKEAYKDKTIKYVTGLTSLSFFIMLSLFAISKYISKLLDDENSHFKEFFLQASSKHTKIDIDKILLSESKDIAKLANKMVEEIENKTKSLQILNATLEEKVAIKTQKLRLKNSELEKSKEILQNVLKSQDKFIKNSIHEINTPLMIILTNIELYEIYNPKNIYFDKILAGIKIIENIYSDLEYSIKKDFNEYKNIRINISEKLQSRINFFENIFTLNQLNLNIEIKDNLFIRANPIEIQRLIDNNLSNSTKYAYPNSVINIKLTKKYNFIIISFQTKSKKIDNLDKIFNRFYRENSNRGGFGIGLSLVKEICDKNDIKISLTSKDDYNNFRYIIREDNESIAIRR